MRLSTNTRSYLPALLLLLILQSLGTHAAGFKIDLVPPVALHLNAARLQCNGSDDTAALRAVVAEARGGPVTIMNRQTCAAGDVTIPNLTIEKGSLLKPITGHTITLSRNFNAGLYQVFENALARQGAIRFAPDTSVPAVLPEWWGAVGNDSVDCTAAIQAALMAHSIVHIMKGIYRITGTSGAALVLNPGQNLFGDGPISVLHKSTTATLIQNANDTVIRDMTLRGRSTGTAFIAGEVALQSDYTDLSPPFTRPINEAKWRGLRSKIYNLVVENWGSNAIQIVGNGTAAGGGSEVSGCLIRNIGQEGILSFGDGNEIHDNRIENVLGYGIDFQGSYNHIVNNTLVNVSDRISFGLQDTGGIVLNGDIWQGGIEANVIERNTLDGGTNIGIAVLGSKNYAVSRTMIRENVIRNAVSNAAGDLAAIHLADNGRGGAMINSIVTGNRIFGSGKDGISTWGTSHTTITDNVITLTNGAGIRAASHLGIRTSDVNIIGNTVKTFGKTSNGITIAGVRQVKVDNNTVSDVRGVPSAPYAGISISEDTESYSITRNNVELETSQGYGLYITGDASHGEVRGNKVSTCKVAIFHDSRGEDLTVAGNDFSRGNLTSIIQSGNAKHFLQKDNAGSKP